MILDRMIITDAMAQLFRPVRLSALVDLQARLDLIGHVHLLLRRCSGQGPLGRFHRFAEFARFGIRRS